MQRMNDRQIILFSNFIKKASMERVLKWFDNHWPGGSRDIAKTKKRKSLKKKDKKWKKK